MTNSPLRSLLAVIALLANASAWAQLPPDYYAPDRVREFADYLFRRGDYLRAAGEYQRYLFVAGSSAQRDSILFRIGLAHRLGGEPRKAVELFEETLAAASQADLREGSVFQMAYAQFDLGEYDRSIQTLVARPAALPQFRPRYAHLRILCHLHEHDWNTAYRIATAPGETAAPELDSLGVILAAYALQGRELPRKSVPLAAALSTAVPGAGKFYARRPYDGIVSLLMVGLTGWQAYNGFRHGGRNSVKGWVYGTISAGFHAGNVYGAVIATRSYNKALEDGLLRKVGVAVAVRGL